MIRSCWGWLGLAITAERGLPYTWCAGAFSLEVLR